MEYVLIADVDNVMNFEKQINNHIKIGFRPFGDTVIKDTVYGGKERLLFFQPMLKTEPNEMWPR